MQLECSFTKSDTLKHELCLYDFHGNHALLLKAIY